METIRCAGYVRVSTPGQVDDESLSTQRKSITNFAKSNEGYVLTKIYSDEGISGGSVRDRHGLLECLKDGQSGKFSVIVVHKLSRFGRNAMELLNNYNELKSAGIELRSISEGIDFSSSYGKFMLTMLAAIAELEKEIIRETTLENRIARGKRGIPTSGAMPYARQYNKETGEWILDKEKAKLMQDVADEYLNEGSLVKIAKRIHMPYNSLVRILSQRCGDQWTVNFKDKPPITYIIPRILPDDVIQRIKDRMAFNRRVNRTDIVYKYVLAGFIRCEKCQSGITGLTFHYPKKDYRYYSHRDHPACKAFTFINANQIEKAVFETIFENVVDVPNFEKAIAESMPDENMILELESKIKNSEKELSRIQKELNRLVDLAVSGTLQKETLHNKEQELIASRKYYEDVLEKDRDKLMSLPDIDSIKQEANIIRRQLLEQFGTKERIGEMSFEDKRNLLHWLFDGKDETGTPYGIYISVKDYGKTGRRGRGREQTVDYFMYGQIVGLRTLKGDNINYMGDVDAELKKEENINYKTKPSALQR
jgi:site-specific DNA recombinase